MESNSGGNDVELLCKTLQVEHKLFYFDLKENPRGRYLKISEKTSATRSTIIVPSNGISWFLDLFNYYVNSDEQDFFSKELQLDAKVVFCFLFCPHLLVAVFPSPPPPKKKLNTNPFFFCLIFFRCFTLMLVRTEGGAFWRFIILFSFPNLSLTLLLLISAPGSTCQWPPVYFDTDSLPFDAARWEPQVCPEVMVALGYLDCIKSCYVCFLLLLFLGCT